MYGVTDFFFKVIFFALILIEFNSIKLCRSTDEFASINDIDVLSELPLEKLLKIRREFDFDYQIDETDTEQNVSALIPEALPLRGKFHKPLLHRGDHNNYFYHNYKRDHKKKLQHSIFQMSVTTLAFLAFGGYLLFLVIHAIKGKHTPDTYYDPNTTQIMSAFLNNVQQNRKKHKKKRPIRDPSNSESHFHSNNNNNNGYYQFKNEETRSKRNLLRQNNTHYDLMYDALVKLSEGYVKYQLIDNNYNNKTYNN